MTRTRRFAGGSMVVGLVVTAVTGCGAGTDGSDRIAVYENPCTMPDSALAAAGLEIAEKRSGTVGVEFNGWHGCTWHAAVGGFTVAAYTGPRKLGDFQRDSMFTRSFVPVEQTSLAGRDAIVFASVLDPDRRAVCAIGVAASTGMALFQANGQASGGDLCAETRKVAAELVGYLPAVDSAAPSSSPTPAVTSEAEVLGLFGDLDPCTVVTDAEVERLTGLPGLTSRRTVSVPARSVGCAWGGEMPSLQIDFNGLVKDDYVITPADERSRQVSAKVGRAVDLTGHDATECLAMTIYPDPRRLVSITIDPPGEEKVDGGVCGRALPVIETVLADRIPWR